MKKRILAILMCLLMTLICGCFTSCWDMIFFIEDGDFKYYYMRETDSYAIVGTTEQGFKKNVYVPSHFRGKEVKRTAIIKGNFSGANVYALEVKNCDRLYFSYLHEVLPSNYIGDVKTLFFVNSSDDSGDAAWDITCVSDFGVGYVSSFVYKDFKAKAFSSHRSENFAERNNYIIYYKESNNSLIKANVSYMFNYNSDFSNEGYFYKEPNNGYFFIDNYESESLIEKVPYEPIREGYTFCGWYKEAECINAWDFNNDRLPKFEYDSEGYITNFKETKLYAKWEKK